MAGTRRLLKELQELRESENKSFQNIVVDEQNILFWKGLLVFENPAYMLGAFKIEMNFPGK
jgi:ubiquitin-protein ligase